MKPWQKIALGVATFFVVLWLLFKQAFNGLVLIKTDWQNSRALFWSPFGIHWVSWAGVPSFQAVKYDSRYTIRVIPAEDGGAPAHIWLEDDKNPNQQKIYYFDVLAQQSSSDLLVA